VVNFSLCCVALLLASIYLRGAERKYTVSMTFKPVIEDSSGPPVDLSLANYRYVAVDDAAQKIRQAHRAARPVTFSPDGYAIFGD
jgi:hypothetical protein